MGEEDYNHACLAATQREHLRTTSCIAPKCLLHQLMDHMCVLQTLHSVPLHSSDVSKT